MRTIQVDIKDDNLTLESTVYTYDRLNQLISSREVTRSGQYQYNYTYDDNGNLINEERKRFNETSYTNIRRYEYTKDNKLEAVYSGNILLVAYTYDGDGTITSSLDRDLDFNQNLNINDREYINSLTDNQRQLINKVSVGDSFLYELTEYITDKNRPYSETLASNSEGSSDPVRASYASPYTEELWQYDYRGNVTTHIDKRENIETFTYDTVDNEIRPQNSRYISKLTDFP